MEQKTEVNIDTVFRKNDKHNDEWLILGQGNY
jgi:hypothetical protein